MAVQTRPYFMIYDGKQRMVEASSPAQAVRHVVGAAVAELRPARGAEVAAWVRANKAIEVAGDPATAAPPAATDAPSDDARPDWDHGDVGIWLADHGAHAGEGKAMAVWSDVVAQGRMTLEHFDVIRSDVPVFAEAIGDFGADQPAGSIDDVRASLEENSMTLNDAVAAVGEAKRRENFIDENTMPEVRAEADDVGEEARDNGGVLANGQE